MKTADVIPQLSEESISSEEYFERMLILERLKSQKNGKQLSLVLLDIVKLIKGKSTEKTFVLRKLISVLNSSTGEIDVKGWYKENTIAGIICKDVKKNRHPKVAGRIKEKLFKEGGFHVTGTTTDAVKLLCLLYPDS